MTKVFGIGSEDGRPEELAISRTGVKAHTSLGSSENLGAGLGGKVHVVDDKFTGKLVKGTTVATCGSEKTTPRGVKRVSACAGSG